MSTNNAQPVIHEGRRYASLTELHRKGGMGWKRIYALKAAGVIVPAPLTDDEAAAREAAEARRAARRQRQANPIRLRGAAGAAASIHQAAETIRIIARRQDDAGYYDATRVELANRRVGLLKALWYYCRRWGGHGVMEVARGAD
jgi:hypothetical protein